MAQTELVTIKVRILSANDPSNWWGEYDTVTAIKYTQATPPVYEILIDQELDDELEFTGGNRVICLDDKTLGLVAAWKV